MRPQEDPGGAIRVFISRYSKVDAASTMVEGASPRTGVPLVIRVNAEVQQHLA